MRELEVSYHASSGMHKFTCDACSTTMGHHDWRTAEDYASYHAAYCKERNAARQSTYVTVPDRVPGSVSGVNFIENCASSASGSRLLGAPVVADPTQDCTNRPLRPGDYVRWENIGWDAFLWIEGVLVSLEPNPVYPRSHHARIDIKRSCGFAVGTTQTVGVGLGVTLRRCERVDDNSYRTYDSTTLGTERSNIVDRKLTVSLDASWMNRAFYGVPGPAKECETCCIPGATAATGRCGHGHLYRSKVRDTAPAPCPVLHDGLTAEQCLARLEQRMHQADMGTVGTSTNLTPTQLAAARELWSAQLRAKREAAKEKERCAVTYCEVDSDD